MVTKVYLVRHCQSMGNIQKRFQGQYDADISPDGEKQLALLGLRFRNEPIDKIYTSPLKRAKLTALAIGQYHPEIPVIEDSGMIEINCGEMENLPLSEIGIKFPTAARNWDESPDLCEFPNGEKMPEVYARVNEALDRIIRENEGKTVVITTHGGVLRNLYARITYGNLQGIRNTQIFGNTSVSLVTAENGALSWSFANDNSHLPQEMRRPPTYYKFSEAIKENEPV